MKIYIQEHKENMIDKLFCSKKLRNIDKYFVNKRIINKIYSKEGIYEINNKTYKLIPVSESIKMVSLKCENKEFNLLIDYSKIEKKNMFKIPYEHVCIPLVISTYTMHNKFLKLIIECINNYEGEEPKVIDYYFEYDIENNQIPIEDINVFLSLLK
jgi:hypothetical protein